MRPSPDPRSRLSTSPHAEAPASSTAPRLHLFVVATTERGTRAALAAARVLGCGLEPQVVLIAPHVVPYPQPLHHPANPVQFTEHRFRALAECSGADVLVRVCVCRTYAAPLDGMMPLGSTVIVGGSRGRWLRTPAQRLATRLSGRGHHVLFIDERPEPLRAAQGIFSRLYGDS